MAEEIGGVCVVRVRFHHLHEPACRHSGVADVEVDESGEVLRTNLSRIFIEHRERQFQRPLLVTLVLPVERRDGKVDA